MLETRGLTAFYGDFQALYGIDISLAESETVAIIGANGAGKSTFLKAITGLLPSPPDAVRLEGASIGGLAPAKITRLGISLVPEGRKLFPSLTVEENLLIGTYGRAPGGYWNLERIYALFPILAERKRVPSTSLSVRISSTLPRPSRIGTHAAVALKLSHSFEPTSRFTRRRFCTCQRP